ncbi:MAG: alpha/beta hydrolase [Gemmatimonadetes bacterium]|nr:alpha/beta hydrolase [Gemmatimonadota bacterium]
MTGTVTHPPVLLPIAIPVGERSLPGVLGLPATPVGVVVFAHGCGSTHTSPRNAMVARVLEHRGFATVRFDLLVPDEAADRENMFDIELLAGRLGAVLDWVAGRPEIAGLPVGLFGASTGAAAALAAAARWPGKVAAVVSRGGRPDLASPWLESVRAPTLLLVGGLDEEVLVLNEAAAGEFRCHHQVAVVRGATHLFEEPGTLAEVARQAADWFVEFGSNREAPSMAAPEPS